jgi:hypothetical protein
MKIGDDGMVMAGDMVVMSVMGDVCVLVCASSFWAQ